MKQLVFVYNAGSGLFSSLSDFAHKIISPSTYQCNLCTLTYGNFKIKNEWKNFIQQSPIETLFLHKDEFEKQYQMNIALPSILMLNENNIDELVSAVEINNCKHLDELKTLIKKSLRLHA